MNKHHASEPIFLCVGVVTVYSDRSRSHITFLIPASARDSSPSTCEDFGANGVCPGTVTG